MKKEKDIRVESFRVEGDVAPFVHSYRGARKYLY